DRGPQDYADELRELMAALDIPSAHICGISFGGMVAQSFALKYPDLVKRLVLVGTTADRTGRSVPDSLAELEREGWPAVADRLVRSWFRPESNPEDIKEAYAIAMQSSQRMRELTLTALGHFDIRDRIHRIAAPTLVVVGQQDMTCPLAMSQTVHQEIAGSRLVTVADCAHLVPVEQPRSFLQSVLPFLRSGGDGAGDRTAQGNPDSPRTLRPG
ncbi:MAG: alpha/beta fold hydrolase, partial [Rhodospirillales bacterium]